MLDLLDYRRRVQEMYAPIRSDGQNPSVWMAWQSQRNHLFRTHPQSPLDAQQKATFTPLPYFEHDPAYRVVAELDRDVEPEVIQGELDDDGPFRMQRIGAVNFEVPGGTGTLSVFWIMGYGGGVFLPFRDTTNQVSTYGAGRYLLDTIKGADLGSNGDKIVLDFNYAYHPSCAHHPRWVCPLAPPENRLDFRIQAGEKLRRL